MEGEIVNRVEKSGIMQFDLEEWIRSLEVFECDISEFLFEGFLLREKDFRQKVKDYNWEQLSGKCLLLSNKEASIITTWGLMLIASEMEKVGGHFFYGNRDEFYNSYIQNKIQNLDLKEFEDKRIIIKGCGKFNLSDNLYTQFVQKIQPVCKNLMFGEACSSVPVFKK